MESSRMSRAICNSPAHCGALAETLVGDPPAGFSESEAKPDRGIDRVAIEVAVRQSTIDL
jgi:hypothetical protein